MSPHEIQTRRGLEAWAAFPADRDPRPVVLLDTIPAVRPSGIFPAGQQELAFLHGAVEAVAGFPAPVLQALRSQPSDDDYDGPPLLVTDATLTSARYETDRGPRVLPTWVVQARDVFHPIYVLDPALCNSGQVWEPSGRKRISGRRPQVVLGADDRTLIMMFIGSPQAYSNSSPVPILELGGAVALAFKERLKPRGAGWYTAQGVLREVVAVLERPLGNRVLLDITGAPVIVTPEQLMTAPVWTSRAQRKLRLSDGQTGDGD
jgi:hypothetical protein